MDDELHATVAAQLLREGQRYTSGRRALVDTLQAANQPLSIREVLERESTLAQSSAYRNLAVLLDARVVRRVLGTDELVRFELAEHLTEHHHHLVCSQCGGVEDFAPPAELERIIEGARTSVGSANGFVADHHRIDFIGTCRSCAA